MEELKGAKVRLWVIMFFILVLALLIVVVALVGLSKNEEVKQNKVGALFIDGVDDDGWSENHYNGLLAACESQKIQLEIMENVDENRESAEVAIDELVAKGCNVIFLTSDGYNKELYPVFDKYPDVIFYLVSPDSELPNTITYFGRLYQVRFLSGMLAGRMTETNVLGFVAGERTAQCNRGINAFALGAKSVNPDAVVKVRFIHTWTDAEAEKEAAEKLIEEDNADVIAYHCSLNSAVDAAEEHDVYSIGYNNYLENYSDKFLCSVNFKWEELYRTAIDDFLKGNVSEDKYYWHGMVYDAVEIRGYSPLVPDEVKKEIKERTAGIKATKDVFYGDIYSNTGKIMCVKGARISDNALLRKMDWFVKGVEIYE